ncbi:hypothetical protein BDW62DRAFT_209476 [Aspergillus aurantiobrunneus]
MDVGRYYQDSHMRPIGLFSTSSHSLRKSIELTLDLFRRGECYAGGPIDGFLTHCFLLDSVPKLLSHHGLDDGHFYLKHADDKGDHVLVDDDYNITGIVDWEWAHTDSKSLAFRSPLVLNVGEFYDGATHISEDEEYFAQVLDNKGRPDLAEIVRRGRVHHLFSFICGYDLTTDWDGFLGLFQGLRRALDVDGELDWEAWREKAMDEYKDDRVLKELMSRCRR